VIEVRHPAPGSAQQYVVARSGVATWTSGFPYQASRRDLVFSNGVLYEAAADSSAASPPPSASWAAVPAWNSATSYTAGARAIAGGNVWIATEDSTARTPTILSPSWVLECPAAQALYAPITTLGTTQAQ
jgi:hypothetical protein